MNRVARWCTCPRCDVVQPALDCWYDYGGYEVTECRFCETTEGAPFNYDVKGWLVTEPTEEELKELFEKLGVK